VITTRYVIIDVALVSRGTGVANLDVHRRLMDQDQRTKEWNAIQRALDAANATVQQLETKVEEEAIAREFEAWEPEPGTTVH
jgi:hypothetical protein